MRKKMMMAVLAAVILATAGCNTSTMTSTPAVEGQTSLSGAKAVANLEADNWGLFLFYWIPIWSGNPSRPNRRDYVMFGNRVQEKYMDAMLRSRAKKLKADAVEDVTIQEDSTGFFGLWIFWRRSMKAMGTAVDKP